METLSDKIVVTRKPHRCFACLRKFEAGTKMKAKHENETFEGNKSGGQFMRTFIDYKGQNRFQ